MRLSFPPLKFSVLFFLCTLAAAQTTPVATLVPPITQLASFGTGITANAAGVAEDSAGNLYLPNLAAGTVMQWVAATGTVNASYVTNVATPEAVALDSAGNLYIADGSGGVYTAPAGGGAATVFQATAGQANVVAVSAGQVYFNDGGTIESKAAGAAAAAATTVAVAGFTPNGLAVDQAGTVWLTNLAGNRVGKVAVGSGTLQLVAYTIPAPSGVAVDGAGNVYVEATASNAATLIYQLRPVNNNPFTLVAGVGSYGIATTNTVLAADVLPAPASEIYLTPLASTTSQATMTSSGLSIDAQGRLLMPTAAGAVWAMPTVPVYSTLATRSEGVASENFPGAALGGGKVIQPWFIQNTSARPVGAQSDFIQLTALGMVNGDFSFAGSAATPLLSNSNANQGIIMCKFDPSSGTQLSAKGNGQLKNPYCEVDVIFQPSQVGLRTSSLQVSFTGANTLGTAIPGGTISLALTGTGLGAIPSAAPGTMAATQPLASSTLVQAFSTAVDPWNNVYLAVRGDSSNNCVTGGVYRVSGQSTVDVSSAIDAVFTNSANCSTIANANGLVFDAAGNMFFTAGTTIYEAPLTSVAANVPSYGTPAALAITTPIAFGNTGGLAIDAAGSLYVSDVGHDTVVKLLNVNNVWFQQIIEGVSNTNGTGTCGNTAPYGDGGAATAAQLCQPSDLAVDAQGDLFIADLGDNSVRMVRGGIISTLTSDVSSPTGLAVDAGGNLYIGDKGNSRVLAIYNPTASPTPTPVTILSSATLASLNSPTGLAVDGSGNLYIADSGATGASILDEVSPASGSVVFGTSQAVGSPVAQNIAIANLGNLPLNWSTGTLISNSGDFVATINPDSAAATCSASTAIAAGSACLATVTFTPSAAGVRSGSVLFNFANGGGSNYTGAGTVTVSASGTGFQAITPTALAVSPASGIGTAGSTLFPFQATVDDQNGNAITSGTGASDSLTVSIASGPGSFASGTFTRTAASGAATFNDLVLTKVGTYTLTITDNTETGVASVNVGVTVTVGAPTAMRLVSGGTQRAFVSTAFANPVVFALTDAYGNPVAGAPVTVTAPGSGAAAGFSAPASSDASGLVTITGVTANATAGVYQLTAVSGAASGVATLANLAANVTTYTPEPVGTPTPTQPITFLFPSGAAVATATVVTQGYTGLDFTSADSAHCAVTFYAGGNCTVDVAFKPTQVGRRLGAVVLADASGNVLQTVYLSGIGQGSLAAYSGNTATSYSTGGAVVQPAIDSKGNLFFVQGNGNGNVVELPAGNLGTPQLPNGTHAYGLGAGGAFDGAGNFYFGANNVVYRVPSANGVLNFAAAQVISNGGTNVIAVDSAGNMYNVGGTGYLEETPAGSTTSTTILSGMGNVQGMAFGTDGNLYATAYQTGKIFQVQLSGGTPTLSAVATPGGNPMALGVDAGGNLYYDDYSTGNLYRVSNAGGSLNFASPTLLGTIPDARGGIAIDAAGAIYITTDTTNLLWVLPQAAAPAQSFPQTHVGLTSGPQTLSLTNTGNLAMSVGTITYDAQFPNQSSTCAASVAPGVTCALITAFAPAAVGNPVSGSLVIPASAFNESGAQTSTETGVATLQAQTITFGALAGVTYPGAPVALAATASSSLPVSFSVVSGPGSIAGTTLTITGAGSIVIAADQAGNGEFAAAAEVRQTLVVAKAADNLAITPSGTFTYPVAAPVSLATTGSSTGAVTYTVTGPATINATTGLLTITGAGTVVVTANQAADANYLAGTATESITVSQAADTLTIGAVGTQTYPVASAITLSATGTSTGAITYTVAGPATIAGNLLTITGAGTVVVTANQAADSNYLAGTATESITVNKGADTLTIGAVATQTYPVASAITLSATGTSTGAITYTVAGPATIAGNVLTITGAGTVVVTANQAADANYLAGTATESITVSQAADTLTIGAVGTQTYPVASAITLSATGTSTGAITYTVAGPATIAGNVLTITGAGTVIVTANQAADANYLAGTATESITVNKAADNLAITPSGTFTYPVAAPVSVATTSNSTGAITFSVTGPATINATTGLLTITGAGTVVVTANQAADGNYLAGTATESIAVSQAVDTLTLAPVGAQTYPVASAITLSATGASTGAITYTVTGPATIAGNVLTITGAGTVIVTANQAADSNYLAGTATESITVSKAADNLAITPSGTFTFPVAAPVSVATTGSSTGAITYTVTGPATINATTGLLTITGAGTVSVTANQAADSNYAAGTANESVTVSKAADTLNLSPVVAQTYPVASAITLSAIGTSTGAITYTVTGPATVSGNVLTITGAGTVSVTANQAADANYLAGTATENITVNQAADNLAITPSGTFTFPVAAPVSLATTGSSTGAITYTVAGPATINATTGLLTITGAGTVVVTANQAADTNYLAGTATESITVSQATDTLNLSPVAAQTYPVASAITLSATGTSTGAITYTVTGPATVAGNLLTITGAGTVVVTANQAADNDYLAGTTTGSIHINAGADTVTLQPVATQTYPVAAPITLSATGTSTGAITYTVSGPATVAGNAVTITGAGTVSVTANQAADANYLAGTANESFAVNKGTDTVTLTPVGAQTYPVSAPITLTATGSSTGAITYTVTGPATVVGNVLTITGAGTVNVTANQAADSNYLAGTASESFTVSQAVDTLSLSAVGPQTYPVGAPIAVAATGSSTGAITYSVTGPATINPTTGALTITGAGTVVVTATQAADANYLGGTATESITVNPATDTLTVGAIATQTYPVAAPITLTATGASTGAITYTVSGPATVVGNVLTITGAGTVTVTANQAADGNYTAGTANASFTVNKATPTITWPAPAAITYGTALGTSQLDATSGGVAGTFTYSPAAGTVLHAGASQALSVTFTPTDSADYAGASGATTLTVNQASQTVTLPTLSLPSGGTVAVGTTITLGGTSSVPGLPITYTVTGPATVSGNVLTVTGTGTITVVATQAGNADYAAASSAAQSFTSGSSTQTISFNPPASMSYGSSLSLSATASSGLAVSFKLISGPARLSGATLVATSVGTVTVEADQAGNSRYGAATAVTRTILVTPAVLTVTANNLSRVYGSIDPDGCGNVSLHLTYSVAGFVNGDTSSILHGAPAESTTATSQSNVGTYPITLTNSSTCDNNSGHSGGHNGDHDGDNDGSGKNDNGKGNDGHDNGQGNGRSGGPSGQGYGFGFTGSEHDGGHDGDHDGGNPSGCSTSGSGGNLTANANYTLVFVNGTLTVTPATLTVAASRESKQLNQANPQLTYTITGYVNHDNANDLSGAPALSTTAVTRSAAGIYTITITQGTLQADNGNYTFTFVNGALVVANCSDRNDPHCDGHGHIQANDSWDCAHWPDSQSSNSYHYWWGGGH